VREWALWSPESGHRRVSRTERNGTEREGASRANGCFVSLASTSKAKACMIRLTSVAPIGQRTRVVGLCFPRGLRTLAAFESVGQVSAVGRDHELVSSDPRGAGRQDRIIVTTNMESYQFPLTFKKTTHRNN
jgi:hypothetical protein